MKLKKAAIATFNVDVVIPLPGNEPLTVGFVFKWQGMKAYFESQDKFRNDEISSFEHVQSMIHSWGFEDEFNEENLNELVDVCPLAANAIFEAYEEAIFKARAKN